MKIVIWFSLAWLALSISSSDIPAGLEGDNKPTIALTFDDGQVDDVANYKLEVWNQRLLDHLKAHNLKAILFSSGANKQSDRGKYVLSSWSDAGHLIANHTYSHPNFNSEGITLDNFKTELLKNDAIIKEYTNYTRYFRFPYLKEGNTAEKVEGFRKFMHLKGYRNGHVTVDASDWYISSRLVKRISQHPDSDISGFRDYYKNHLFARAQFYDSLSYALTNRRISHVLLLHHNLAASLFLDDLIRHFQDHGWRVIDAEEAYRDEIYNKQPETIPAGESLIWALANDSGRFERVLRYPAEDSRYEKPLMDKLGL